MKPTYATMLLAFVLFSCAPLRNLQDAKLNAPILGAIGKENKSLISKNFQQIGQPTLARSVAISVQEIPFTKSTFKEYSVLKTQKGDQPNIVYVDSLSVKPKYLRLEIKDKIGLLAVLNDDGNSEVRSYLEKDADCRIVSSISLYIPTKESNGLAHAAEVFLGTNNNGSLQIELINGKERQMVILAEDEIFDYSVMGFCWGEDIYGNARLETLSDKGGCPNGTEKSAQKLSDNRSYLKL